MHYRYDSTKVQNLAVGDVIWSDGAFELRTCTAIRVIPANTGHGRTPIHVITWADPTGQEHTYHHPASATFKRIAEVSA